MPTRIIRYDLAAGGSILVEEELRDQGDHAGFGDAVTRAAKGFEEAVAGIRPAVAAVLEQVASLPDGPQKVTFELGFTLKGELGAVLAKASTEGSIKLSLTWERPAKPAG